MNVEQEKAAKSLTRALNKCEKAGLQGGVFDGTFCLWPTGSESPHRVEESGENDFLGAVEKECGGEMLVSKLYMDGGAGN